MQQLTNHAVDRLNARSVHPKALDCLLAFGDFEQKRPGNAAALRISRSAAAEAITNGIPSAVVERAQRLCAIVADGRVITLYRHDETRRSRRRAKLTWRR